MLLYRADLSFCVRGSAVFKADDGDGGQCFTLWTSAEIRGKGVLVIWSLAEADFGLFPGSFPFGRYSFGLRDQGDHWGHRGIYEYAYCVSYRAYGAAVFPGIRRIFSRYLSVLQENDTGQKNKKRKYKTIAFPRADVS